MKRRRGLLVAILVYIALDLSLPAMPGAFVFEPSDSVESIQISRGRAAAEVVVLPVAVEDSSSLTPPRVDPGARLVRITAIGRPRHAVVSLGLPRASLDPAPASEESH